MVQRWQEEANIPRVPVGLGRDGKFINRFGGYIGGFINLLSLRPFQLKELLDYGNPVSNTLFYSFYQIMLPPLGPDSLKFMKSGSGELDFNNYNNNGNERDVVINGG